MKARIIFNLDINQMVSIDLLCSSFNVHNYDLDEQSTQYAYSMELLSGDQEEVQEERRIMPVRECPEI